MVLKLQKEQLKNYLESNKLIQKGANMKGYRFITDDDTVDFCQRVTEALSNGWKLHGEPKMTFDHKKKSYEVWSSSCKTVIKKI